MNEMSRIDMPSNTTDREKFMLKLKMKTDQMAIIKEELTNFQNIEFKSVVSQFLQWCIVQSSELFVLFIKVN